MPTAEASDDVERGRQAGGCAGGRRSETNQEPLCPLERQRASYSTRAASAPCNCDRRAGPPPPRKAPTHPAIWTLSLLGRQDHNLQTVGPWSSKLSRPASCDDGEMSLRLAIIKSEFDARRSEKGAELKLLHLRSHCWLSQGVHTPRCRDTEVAQGGRRIECRADGWIGCDARLPRAWYRIVLGAISMHTVRQLVLESRMFCSPPGWA
jgi:hypothetical protein